jgi:hypothetical protein
VEQKRTENSVSDKVSVQGFHVLAPPLRLLQGAGGGVCGRLFSQPTHQPSHRRVSCVAGLPAQQQKYIIIAHPTTMTLTVTLKDTNLTRE